LLARQQLAFAIAINDLDLIRIGTGAINFPIQQFVIFKVIGFADRLAATGAGNRKRG
jgi:hypothetical protein